MSLNEKELNKAALEVGGKAFSIMGWIFTISLLALCTSPLFWIFGSLVLFGQVALTSLGLAVLTLIFYGTVRHVIKEKMKEELSKTKNN